MRSNTNQPKPLIEPLEGRALFSATLADADALAAPTRLAPSATEPAVVVSKTSVAGPSPTSGAGTTTGIIAILIGL